MREYVLQAMPNEEGLSRLPGTKEKMGFLLQKVPECKNACD